jgi:hypothetical protein
MKMTPNPRRKPQIVILRDLLGLSAAGLISIAQVAAKARAVQDKRRMANCLLGRWLIAIGVNAGLDAVL